LKAIPSLKPVIVTIHYTDAEIQGIDEDTLILNYWDGNTWVDAACGAYDRHPEANWLSVPICHLSQFGLMGEVKIGTSYVYIPFVRR
jgi:hypothetical protein